jgi:uncharacterized protein (TIGR03437 family)
MRSCARRQAFCAARDGLTIIVDAKRREGDLSGVRKMRASRSRFFFRFSNCDILTGLFLFGLCVDSTRAQTANALPAWDAGTEFVSNISPVLSSGYFVTGCSVVSGSLPPGITYALTSSSACLFSGIPTLPGSYSFTLAATTTSPVSHPPTLFSITINPALSITNLSPLASGSTNSPYSVLFSSSGGTAPLNWYVSSGVLPPGLSLGHDGTLSGTPTQSGAFNFTIQLADALSTAADTEYYSPGPTAVGIVSKSFSLSIGAQSQPLAALPTWDVGSGFNVSFSTGSSTPSATSCSSSGNLPPGLAYGLVGSSGNGYCELKGTPTMAGAYTFTISVVDGSGPSSGPFNMTINPARTITVPSPLPNGVMNSAYNSILFVGTGGTLPFTATYSGSLPTGMIFDDGLLSGTPTQSGTFNFTVQVADALSSVPDTAYYPPGTTTEGIVSKPFQLTISGGTPVPTITSITNAAGEGSAIAENTWIEIKGVNLAPDTRTWRTSDFLNNQLPAELDGVSATVNGKNAYVYYISPTQVNVLTPLDSTLGPVQVKLTNNGIASTPFNLQLQSYAPGFFEFNGGPYAAATHSNGGLAGPASLFPGSSTPVTPGEIMTLYADGFGQTSPPLTSGLVTQTGTLPALPIIKIGGVAATVQFAGVVAPGLYQLNVYVPASAPSGDNAVVATYNGVSSNTATISVGAPTSNGTLQIQITGLPSGPAGNVSITSTFGFSALVTTNQTLQVPAGTYTIVANSVPFGGVSYGAFPSQQSVILSGGSINPVTVSYSVIIPNTTQVLDPQGNQGLSVSADGNTLTLPTSSQVAAGLSAGSVLAVGATPATPNGLLRKVVSTSQSGGKIQVQTTQATLLDAFQQANFTFSAVLGPQNAHPAQTLPAGISIRRGAGFTITQSAVQPQASLQIPCTDQTSILVQMFDTPIVQDPNGSITASGEIQVCPSFEFDWSIQPFSLKSLTATATLGEDTHVNITGSYKNSFDQKVSFPVTFDPIVVPVGEVPVVLTPTITFFVGASGNVNAGFSVGVTQAVSFTGGVSYNNGSATPVFSHTGTLGPDPLGLDASESVKGYAGMTIALQVEGIVTPQFSPDTYFALNSNIQNNPWWTLSAGLEGDASVAVSIFGLTHDFDFPGLFDYSQIIAQASGGFAGVNAAPVLTSVAPSSATAGSSGLSLTLIGSNFVPGATAKFNGNLLATTFVNPGQLTANLPATQLNVAGTFSVTVTNPDQPTVPSAPVNFIVQPAAGQNPTPAITNLSPSSAIAGTSSLTVTINGSGFLTSSTVEFNGAIRAASLVSASQLSLSLVSSDLNTPGTFPIIVTNPAPGGGSSQPAAFTVQQGTVTLTLQNLTLNAATAIGGSSVIGTVTLSGPAPNGGTQVTLSSSSSSAQVPASVTVPSGQSTATFTIATTVGNTTQTVVITAVLGNVSKTATLSVASIPLTNVFLGHDLELDGATVLDGQTTPFHISLSLISGYSAQFGNISNPGSSSIAVSIAFSSAFSTEAINGNSVTLTGIDPTISEYSNIAEGIIFPQTPTSATLTLTVSSSGAGSSFTGTISFTVSGVQHQASFAGTVSSCNACTLPAGSPSLQGFTLSSNAVDGGFFLGVTATLAGTNPTGDTSVYLASSNPNVPLPLVLTVPYNQTSATLLLTAPKVAATQTAVVSAGLGTTLESATVTVSPTSLTNIWTQYVMAAGTATIDGIAVQMQCDGGAVISYAFCTTATNSQILLAVGFEQLVSFSGQTLTFGAVDANSIFAPNPTGAGAQPVTSGTLSLTGSSTVIGSPITGTLSFTAGGVTRQLPLSLSLTQGQ